MGATQRVMAQEHEYMLTGFDAHGNPLPRGLVVSAVMDAARTAFPYLPRAGGTGAFIANGSLLYEEIADHVELATGELLDPWDAVRYCAAGDKIMALLASKAPGQRRGLARVDVFTANVSYVPGITWSTCGTHECHGYRGSMSALSGALIPYLASRVIISGSGGFSNMSPGIQFLLSPRSSYISAAISADSTCHRALFHQKNQSHGHLNRLHIIAGEHLYSHLALLLKFGCLAALVALVDDGDEPGGDVKLADPVAALHTFSEDPSCQATVRLAKGGHMRAVDIQRRYLEAVEQRADSPGMPEWTGRLCAVWRRVLDLIEEGAPHSVAPCLDWAAKYVVFTGQAERGGFAWDTLPRFNHLAKMAHEMMRAKDQAMDAHPLARHMHAHAGDGAEPLETAMFDRMLSASGVDRDSIARFLELRNQLFLLDLRFGQLGGDGIFSALDRDGVFQHRIEGVDDASVERAMHEPPANGRARLRGNWVRELSGNSRATCMWEIIHDVRGDRVLIMNDPLSDDAEWKPNGTSAARERPRPRPRVSPRQPGLGDGLFGPGDRVVLGRHEPVGGDLNWTGEMDDYVGRAARIADIVGNDISGCVVAHVDVDHGRYVWRLVSMERAEA